MRTAIEVTASHLRICAIDRGRIAALEEVSVAAGQDPVAALAAWKPPFPLGRVRVVLNHADMLIRTMVQPPAPAERLGRIIQFELKALTNDQDPETAQIAKGAAGGMLYAWLVPAVGGASGDMRILAMVTKRELVRQLGQTLKEHGGRLEALVHPAAALWTAYRRQIPNETGAAAILDLGGENLHAALVKDGELVFIRSSQPGLNDLVKDVAGLRGLPVEDAGRMLSKLSAGAPEDLMDLVRRKAASVATTLGNHIRFAKAQLRLEGLEPQVVYLTGAGARVHGLAEALAERLKAGCRILNPFAGRTSALASADLDRHCQLPSPWAAVMAAADAEVLPLDAVSQVRDERRAFWMTRGALRTAVVAAGVLLAAAFGMLHWRSAVQQRAAESLLGDTGLVQKAKRAEQKLNQTVAETSKLQEHMAVLDALHLPSRMGVEILNVVARLQDPRTTPIFLTDFRIERKELGQVEVRIEGYAQDGVRAKAGEVLDSFRDHLQKEYPLMNRPVILPTTVGGRQSFLWSIALPDRRRGG